jgi:hypothetical protein
MLNFLVEKVTPHDKIPSTICICFSTIILLSLPHHHQQFWPQECFSGTINKFCNICEVTDLKLINRRNALTERTRYIISDHSRILGLNKHKF